MAQLEKLNVPEQVLHWVNELRDTTQPVWLRDNTAYKLELLTTAISKELDKYLKTRSHGQHYKRRQATNRKNNRK